MQSHDDLKQAEQLHQDALVFLGYVNYPAAEVGEAWFDEPDRWLRRGGNAQFDLPGALDAGVDAAVLSVPSNKSLALGESPSQGCGAPVTERWREAVLNPSESREFLLSNLQAVEEVFRHHPGKVHLCRDTQDLEIASQAGALGCFMQVSGHDYLEDIAFLGTLKELGITSLHIAMDSQYGWIDASSNKPIHGGISEFGLEVIREMNRVGLLIDLSHATDQAAWKVLDVTRKPIIWSHANARALSNIHRNVPDDLLMALKKCHGVIGIHLAGHFIVDRDWIAVSDIRDDAGLAWHRQIRATAQNGAEALKLMRDHAARETFFIESGLDPTAAQRPHVTATVSELVDHIDHMVQIAGVDCVGLGTDFAGIEETGMPREVPNVAALPRIAAELLKRKYSESDIRKILGENFRRVFAEVLDG